MASQCRAIDDFCRLCAIESQSGVIIYSTEGENLCLEEKILNCLRIEVSRDDMLPKRVCQSCNLLLDDYYRFSERATQVQQTLYFLLGLHLPHSQEQETQWFLMEDGVKLESNIIKNELDEFIVQQGNVHNEGEKFDLLVAADETGSQSNQYCNAKESERGDDIAETNQELCSTSDMVMKNGGVKHCHRRKMLMPKKTLQDKNSVDDYFVKNGQGKADEFNEKNIFQDINDENDEEGKLSSDEDEEHRKMNMEWSKKWGILCDICKDVFHDRLLFERHYRYSHSKKPVYTCSYCKKSISRASVFKSHKFEHICEGRFRCKFCQRKFCSKEMLEIHLEFIHNQMKAYICECGMSFTSQKRLDLHEKKHKSNTKELRCSECGKILQTRGGLAAHKSVHKLGRHYMCHICGKTFTQKINMQQHVKYHKGEKPHSCDICEKSFAEKSHLNRHKKFHTKERPFQCSVCKKMYKTERCLKVHSQIHCNSRPYVCSFCGKGFLSSTKLKQHHNCHTGERPFACKYCERTFTNYPNWLKHTRRRHKVDHKTGLSLKEETQTQTVISINPVPESFEILESAIEFIEMPDVEVKEDGRDSVHSQHSVLNMIGPSILGGSQFQIVQDGECQYQMNLLPDLVSSQERYAVNALEGEISRLFLLLRSYQRQNISYTYRFHYRVNMKGLLFVDYKTGVLRAVEDLSTKYSRSM